ncbi:MAG TPA: hypothetical protein VGM60_02315 [Pseudonocardia sp.]|jgi:DNA-3-methyladenine glycosylase II|uniref:hypothetical protein n=1 Tax=Pseudonocardia sp. TaxID=60912 RepID=UPI002F3FAB88
MRKDVGVIVSSVMAEHPGWSRDASGTVYRVVRSDASVWLLTGISDRRGRVETRAELVSGAGAAPTSDVADPAELVGPTEMVAPLRESGVVARWRNPNLWDAISTAIVRQVVRAGQARNLYRRFCQAHGELIATRFGPSWLFPDPAVVLELPDSAFTEARMAFKRRPLQAAALAMLESGSKWSKLDPMVLIDELRSVTRIGPWTARASVADFCGDFALYPVGDLAVRTWATRLAPGRAWPEDEPAFARAWTKLSGDQLCLWTLLTLAWGAKHASNTRAIGS